MAKQVPTTKAGKARKRGKVLSEFKQGTLRSSSGQKVAGRKQAIAIALSESGESRAASKQKTRKA